MTHPNAVPPSDLLDRLLPDSAGGTAGERGARADAGRERRATRLVTLARLLSDDARPGRAEGVAVDLDGARRELDALNAARRAALLGDLAQHHLAAALGPERFAALEAPRCGHARAWSELEALRAHGRPGSGAALPAVPAPGEPPLEVARRLLAPLLERGTPRRARSTRARLWECRLAHAADGARAAEARYRELLSERGSGAARTEAVAGVAACLLERGAVGRARAWLEEHRGVAGREPRVARLLGWAALCAGDVGAARDVLGPLGPWRGTLPTALVELRERRPEWLPLLSGRDERAARETRPVDARPIDARSEIGAALLAVVALGPGHVVRPLLLDAAPSLAEALPVRLDRRDGACRRPGEPEHALLTRAVALEARGDDGPPRGALAGRGVRALALVPVPDVDGEVAGWVRVECEHHLLPPRARLAATARAWAARVQAAARGPLEPPSTAEVGAAAARARPAVASRDPRAVAVRALVERLGMKTARRAWWGFEVERGMPRLLARGGGWLADRAGPVDREDDGRPGAARALARALRTRSPIVFEAADSADRDVSRASTGASLALHPRAGSGVALPLVAGGVARGALVVESPRRGDFPARDVERWARLAGRSAGELAVARFRAWHARDFGHDLAFDPEGAAFGPLLAELLAAAGSRAPVALVGPAGCGKRVLARWLHFEGGRGERRFVALACSEADAARLERRLLGGRAEEGLLRGGRCGSVLLADVDRLERGLQARLAERLAARSTGGPDACGDDAPRLILAVRRPLAEARESGALLPALADRLDRLQLHVPPLAARRDEVPALLDLLVARFAAEERVRPPVLGEDVVALLWRQPWPGNLRQLERFVHRLVVLRAGATPTADEVRALATRAGLELLERLPSRRPDRGDLLAALRTTRKANGRIHRARAALFLGWDPDTLAARLREARLEELDANGQLA